MNKRRIGRRALSLLLVLVLLLSLCTQAFAEDSVAEDETGKVYTSISDAWAAAKKGKVITLTADWNPSDRLILNKNESAVLDLNGYTIDAQKSHNWADSDGEIFYLDEGANLTLKSSAEKKTIKFEGWGVHKLEEVSVISGGLIAGGRSENGAGGIHMKKDSTLTLDNVTLGGCRAEEWLLSSSITGEGGAINMAGSGCTLIMKNGAQVAYNCADDDGGGIYVNDKNCKIELSGGSSIHHNYASDNGGGVYFCYGCFSIRSDDLSGSITDCRAKDDNGGAIYVEQCKYTTNLGMIYGLTMENNSCDDSGGAIYINQENITVSRCTLRNNTGEDGGAIYVDNDNCTISNCTIEQNHVADEGGGVYVTSTADIGLSGTLYIRNNKRDDGAKDDLFLNKSTQTSYISSSPSGNSEVGVRTTTTERNLNDTDDRTFFYEQAFFSDFAGYHIEYDGTTGYLKYVQGEADPAPETTVVTPGTKETVGTYNGQDVIRGYFRYPAVLTTDVELSSNYYYSDGYFLDGTDSKGGDPTVYNEHLATTSMAMVLAGCSSNLGLNNEIKNQSEYNLDYTYKSQNIEVMLADMGFEKDLIYTSDNYTLKPGKDTIDVAIAQKNLPDSEYTLVPIVVRSVGYESEWANNFTIGSSGEATGFAYSAGQIVSYVNKYIESYGLQEKAAAGKIKFWIMGYSRGAGVANVAAKYLVEDYSYTEAAESTGNQVYAYCIAAPQAGRNSEMKLSEGCYYCIHNCINKADPVPELAPDEMGFMRYGVDHYVPGDGTASSTVQTDTYVWTFVKNESWAKDYKTWYDNESWTVGSEPYKTQRTKMLAQLASIDPVNISFTDYFAIAEQDVFPTSTDALECSGASITQEEFIHVLVRGLQAWGFYHGYQGDFRDGYSGNFSNGNNKAYPSFEGAIRVIVPIYYNLSTADREGMLASISYGADDMLSSIYGKFIESRGIYDNVIGDWCDLDQDDRDEYIQKFWDYLMCTEYPLTGKAAIDYLTADDQKAIRGVWDVLLDVTLRFVAGDYNNDVNDWNASETPVGEVTVNVAEHYAENYKNYGNHAMVVLGTILYNSASIAQGHYPEINYAWLRSYDSFYENDGNKPLTIQTDVVPTVAASCTTAGVLTLATDPAEAAIYYRLSSDGTDYGDWIPYNRSVSLPAYAKYVQTTAIYYGNYSDVQTEDIALLKAKDLAAPEASIPAGTYTTKLSIRLTNAAENARIYYTLDGTEPNETSTLYTKGTEITIYSSTVLKAVAIWEGFSSPTATFQYTIAAESQDPSPSTDTGKKDSDSQTPETGTPADCKKDRNCPVTSFDDASSSAWYHDGVHYCLENGLMNGYSEDRFGPDDSISRGQVVTMLWRVAGSPVCTGGTAFSDVADSAYYAQAVLWASENGIVLGYGDGTFGPDDPVTREQLAATLSRYAVYAEGSNATPDGSSTALRGFDDADTVSSWALPAMRWACENGILNGIGSSLVPQGKATRAQCAVIFQRFCEMTN